MDNHVEASFFVKKAKYLNDDSKVKALGHGYIFLL